MILTFKDLALDLDSLTLTRDGAELYLPKKQFLILKFLLENKNICISHERLFDNVWGFGREDEYSALKVKQQVSLLRKKLKPGHYIDTRHSFGYIIYEPRLSNTSV